MKPFIALLVLITGIASAQTIVCPADAPANVKLAAKEIRRYVYLRTGELVSIADHDSHNSHNSQIFLSIDPALAAQQYRLKTVANSLSISGGSDIAVLYGAYAMAEKLGVRFYLHGDVIPDGKIPFILPQLDETRKPLFDLRGVNPWGSHPFGFDAWSADDYKSVITQLAKMRMNFIGMHCYPEGHPYAEPTVWHGLTGDFDAQGRVQSSYVSRYFNTLLTPGWGDYQPKDTRDYSFGGALLFDRDDWAPPVMAGYCPLPQTPEACNDVFNRMGAQFNDAFTFARLLGVKTCLGTETPLTMPKSLASRTTDVRAVYEGTFKRILASHPLDYYWLWTPEGWTWSGNQPAQYQATVADIKLANEALRNVKAPFQLATAGWVLGPVQDRAALDKDLPKNIALSAINRNTGAVEVDPAFGKIPGRERWAIPWLESDNRSGLATLQLEAGRMLRDAADARAYGCTGLMGLHWRTEILSPNISALAKAAWDQPSAATPPVEIMGTTANYPAAKISGTQVAPLYQSCRYDLGSIKIAVPNGKYKVTLKFCEPHFNSAGQRVFDVQVQGRTVLANLDIFANVGQFAAFDFTADTAVVTDGMLVVNLVARTSLPCISAIAIEGNGISRKINCGGPAYQDWQADVPQPRALPCGDFYADWAHANFGLAEVGQVFAAIDGKVPQVTDGGCPTGKLTPVKQPWATMVPGFAFVDELEKFRPRIQGAGNLERFDYWLNTFKYHRSLAQLRCAMAQPATAELTRLWGEACRYLLATVNSPGALAMVVNMENHPGWGPLVAKSIKHPFSNEYQGTPRLIVPTVRSVATQGEALTLKIIALDQQPVKSVTVHLRPLGHGEWQVLPAKHVVRAVFQAILPAATEDFEYYITAVPDRADLPSKIQNSKSKIPLVWPATAPVMNQSVVVIGSVPE